MTPATQRKSTPREIAEILVEIHDEDEEYGISIDGEFIPVVGAYPIQQIGNDIRRRIAEMIEVEREK